MRTNGVFNVEFRGEFSCNRIWWHKKNSLGKIFRVGNVAFVISSIDDPEMGGSTVGDIPVITNLRGTIILRGVEEATFKDECCKPQQSWTTREKIMKKIERKILKFFDLPLEPSILRGGRIYGGYPLN